MCLMFLFLKGLKLEWRSKKKRDKSALFEQKKTKKSISATWNGLQSKNVFSKMFLELIFTIEKWYTKLI